MKNKPISYPKIFLLICMTLIYLNAMSQIEVKEGSFHKIHNYVMDDADAHVDGNGKPMALIKISTENISAEERDKFYFKGNKETDCNWQQKIGEIYLYITAHAATIIEIKHDDFGKYTFDIPEKLCDYCCYEMVVISNYKPVVDTIIIDTTIIVAPEYNKVIYPKYSSITVNAAYYTSQYFSYGFTYGQLRKFGWFVSAMSNFNFIGMSVMDEPFDEVAITANESTSIVSVTAGIMTRLNKNVAAKVGAGFGMRIRACETISGEYVEYSRNTYKGIDATVGLLFDVKRLALGIDAVTTNFKTLEIKIGVGLNWE